VVVAGQAEGLQVETLDAVEPAAVVVLILINYSRQAIYLQLLPSQLQQGVRAAQRKQSILPMVILV
jgi:hypothetical protein